MPVLHIDLFNEIYPAAFWHKHAPHIKDGQLIAIPRTPKKTGDGHTGLITISSRAQVQARAALKTALSTAQSPDSKDGLILATSNIIAFHDAFPHLPKLVHPATLVRGPVTKTIEQLTYHFVSLELHNLQDATYIADLCPARSPIAAQAPAFEVDDFHKEATAFVQVDNGRLQFKNDYLTLLTGAAFHQYEQARSVAAQVGVAGLPQDHKVALRALHKAVKRSLVLTNQEMSALEGFYSRAASYFMQVAKTDGAQLGPSQSAAAEPELAGLRGFDGAQVPASRPPLPFSSPEAPWRLANLFGPGELIVDTLHAAKRMRHLFEESFDVIDYLRTKILQPRLSELAVLDRSFRDLLFLGASKPPELGPLSSRGLFRRNLDRLKQ